MSWNRYLHFLRGEKGLVFLSVLVVILVLFIPVGLIFAEEPDPPETNRNLDAFHYPTQEDNLDLTRGMMVMSGVMILIVVVSTLRILRLDQVSRPHLLMVHKKRSLPDATIKKPDEVKKNEPPES